MRVCESRLVECPSAWALPLDVGPASTPATVAAIAVASGMGVEAVEVFAALLLDARQHPIAWVVVSRGTATASLVHPREVYGPALRHGATALVVVHNHPSGNPEPSHEDLEVTRRLVRAGALLGVPLLDHVVIGGQDWVSIREESPGMFS